MKFNLRHRLQLIMLKLKILLLYNNRKRKVTQNTYLTSQCKLRLQLIMEAMLRHQCLYALLNWITWCRRMELRALRRPSQRHHMRLRLRNRYERRNILRLMTRSNYRQANQLIQTLLAATICGAANLRWNISPESLQGRQISSHLHKYNKQRELPKKLKNREYGWRY
jgi:hypothetical protein